MAKRTLAQNVAQVKADFKAVKDAVGIVIPEGTPTSEYGERVFNTISSLENEIENSRTEGIEQGKQEVISNSKYIEKTASGKVIRLDDVSEVYHNIRVKADTPTEVKVYGKNLFDISPDTRLTKQDDGSYINNAKIDTAKIPLSLPNGSYVLSYDLSCPSGKNARIRVYLKDGSYKETATSSNGGFVHIETSIVGEIESWGFYYASMPLAETLYIKNPQIERGSASKYEPYKEQTITATPEGTEVSSICPAMTFITDNDVTVDYFGSYGREAQRLEWWRKYLNDGNLTSFAYAFSYYHWTDETFDPPYNIKAMSCSNIFAASYVTDLRGILARNGVELIFDDSKPQNNQFYNLFTYSRLTYAPYFRLPTTCTCYGWFTGCSRLKEVDGYECTEIHTFETSSGGSKTFQECAALEHIIFHGTIANNINLQWSTKLDLESLISLFRCLKSFASDDTNYMTKTITLSAESWALTETQEFMDEFEGQYGKMFAHYFGWNVA